MEIPHLTQERSAKFTEKRLAVLKGAARVFARLGFHKTSLAGIGQELSISGAALYYYVKSKDQLFSDCSMIAFDELKQALNLAADEPTGLAALLTFLKLYGNIICNDFGRCLAIHRLSDIPSEASAENLRGRRLINDAVGKFIVRGIADSTIRSCDEKMMTAFVFGAFNALASAPPKSMREGSKKWIDAYLDIVAQGLRGPGAV